MAIKIDKQLVFLKGAKSAISDKMAGNKYGRLTVLEFVGVAVSKSGNRRAMVRAKCDCGSIHIYEARILRDGTGASCGCFQAENTSKIHIKHGQKSPKHGNRGTIMYARWRSMFDRVRSDQRYTNVKISDRWKGDNGFDNFCKDMGEMPSKKHTVDRFPICNGNYEPSNCRWATMMEQAQNTRKNVKHFYNGQLLCQSEIARREGINVRELSRRIRYLGLSIDEAIKYEPFKTNKKWINKL
jgi:hypothetical protein